MDAWMTANAGEVEKALLEWNAPSRAEGAK
jgi:hypothetical protein